MNVLLVDDDEDFVNSLSRLLKKFDINTVNELRTSGAKNTNTKNKILFLLNMIIVLPFIRFVKAMLIIYFFIFF